MKVHVILWLILWFHSILMYFINFCLCFQCFQKFTAKISVSFGLVQNFEISDLAKAKVEKVTYLGHKLHWKKFYEIDTWMSRYVFTLSLFCEAIYRRAPNINYAYTDILEFLAQFSPLHSQEKWIFVRTCGWHRDTQYNNNHHNDTHSSNIQYNEKQHNKYLCYENSL